MNVFEPVLGERVTDLLLTFTKSYSIFTSLNSGAGFSSGCCFSFTVTAKFMEISSALAVTVAFPFETAVTVAVLPSTVAVAILSSEE